jgi:hypothetical protein
MNNMAEVIMVNIENYQGTRNKLSAIERIPVICVYAVVNFEIFAAKQAVDNIYAKEFLNKGLL